jgi:hypothetical protein
MIRPPLIAALVLSSGAALALQTFPARADEAAAAVLPNSAVPAPAQPTQSVVVQGHYDNAVGTSDAASQGSVTSTLIAARPTLRPAEVLEFVPGVIVSQHSGDGKANQYYLRGFNLDHGTDFASFVDGMPVNMPTHAHGQGYSDLNWLIPELIDRIRYKKGPYFADEGDFASAGAAHIDLFDTLPHGIASITLGAHEFARALVANSSALRTGNLLYAIEAGHNNGPWDNPEKFHRFNSVLRYSLADGVSHTSLTAMAYDAHWDSTDQIPLRAVQDGQLSRFGAVDPTDHGGTSRFSLSFNHQRTLDDGNFQLDAYAIRSKLDLFSDFTYFLDDPVHGDQFEQAEQRQVFGLTTHRRWDTTLAGHASSNTIGLQVRQDRLTPVGLYTAEGGVRTGVTQQSTVRETSAGLYAENATTWAPWLRSVAGLRTDHYDFDVNSSIAANSGRKHAELSSPKLSLIFGPWDRTEYFVNYGWGFHSNDARGVNETVTPKEGLPADPSPGLVRSKGGELGLRTQIIPGLQTSISLWQLNLASELVFSGDAGDTEASGASRRRGLEVSNHYIAAPWLLFDADLSFSQARFDQPQGEAPNLGRSIPGSVGTVASFGATVVDRGPWFGQFQLRYFGPRPLIEDDSVRSHATTLAYLRVGYKLATDVKVAFDVFNLFDQKSSDIDYYYASRLQGEPADGVNDIHFHPVEPRSLRVTLTASF